MGILYEITGYQAEGNDINFWDDYQDCEDMGSTNLVRSDKNEQPDVMQPLVRMLTRERDALEDSHDAT